MWLDEVKEAEERDEARRVKDGALVLQRVVNLPSIAERIQSIKDVPTANEAIDDKDFLESALKRAHQYAEYAKEFCVAECQMYVKIASVVKTLNRKGTDELIIQWLRSKTDNEIALVAEECSRGIRIAEVRRQEMAIARFAKRDKAYETTINKMLTEYVQDGRTEISMERFYRDYDGGGKIDNKKAAAWLDRARIEVRQHGAVAIGDRKGTYVNANPSSIDKIEEIRDAVQLRLEGIASDIRSVEKICESSGIRPNSDALDDILKALKDLSGVSDD
jgi:hypothetical protein